MLLLQEFDMEIHGRKESKNLMADHLSTMEPSNEIEEEMVPINEEFIDEQLRLYKLIHGSQI